MLISKIISLLHNPQTIKKTKQIHSQIIVNNQTHHLHPLLIHQIISSSLSHSPSISQYLQLILLHSQPPHSPSWITTIRFLTHHSHFKDASSLYFQMQRSGLGPTTSALSSSLKACAKIGCVFGGVLIHGQVQKFGFEGCVYVNTALVGFYTSFGEMGSAKKVFSEMGVVNVVTWNSMLSGYLRFGDFGFARKVFNEMPERDVVSWNVMVSGYARKGDMESACSLFCRIPERNSASWNAMVSGYVEAGRVELARRFFDQMPKRNNVSWITMISGYSKRGDVDSANELFCQMGEKDPLAFNAMIACYAQNSRPKEAIQLFNMMLEENVYVQPDEMTLASVISACAQLGDIRFGAWIESYMKQVGIEVDDHLRTALVDLYAKCGSIDKAYELFRGLKKKDLVAYSAMILGYGINGRARDAIELFKEMMDSQICPNLVTFTGLLTAYNHAGLIEEGYQCLSSMTEHGLVPLADHYGIMVDLLGRAGRVEEAYNLIISMPMPPHAGVWGALLLACRVHNNVELGEIAAKHCFELEPDTSGYCSLLANIYASVERWDDAKKLRKAVTEKGVRKVPGCSWMEST